MQRYDALIVGGGPAGSACARRLVEAGWRVAVLDRAEFPRTKLCAGWITPGTVRDLDLDLQAYPHRINTFDHIVVHLKGLRFNLDTVQHSIRRYEFDDYLLRESGAEVIHHTVKELRRGPAGYEVDGLYEAPYLVGAGGTRCPVYRTFFRDVNPRARELQAATYEHEFPYEWTDERCHLWFFDGGLPGYAWYVPKARAYLNCGIGGMAAQLKARGEDIKAHWRHFTNGLAGQGLVRDFEFEPKGYSYYLRGAVDVVARDGAFITGDAAGLATRDLCEGIGPAVRSGQRAAASILTGEPYRLDDLGAYSSDSTLARKLLEYLFVVRGRRLERRAA